MSFAYDAIGRKTTESLSVNFGTARTYVVTHAYDADNRETATTYPNGKIVNRSYTSRDQLGEVDYDSAMVANFTYDAGGRETQRTLGNGLDTRREYNRGDNLVTNIINETAPGSSDRPDASFAYTYDANKNPTSETTGSGSGGMNGYSYTASYDAKDRLTGWNRANSIDSQLWKLTHVGDWSSTTVNGTTQTRKHNAVHELTGIAGNTLKYDPKGDLTREVGDTVDRFKWDFDNKMAAADTNQDGSNDLAFTYDALGRRVSKDDVATGTDTVYVCSGQQVVAEYAANDDPATTAPQQVYVYGRYVDEPLMKVDAANGKLYYLRNRQYCITAMTDPSGNVVERYAYTAYGVTTILAPDGIAVRATSAVGNPYMYTGRRLDKEFATSSENAVYYYRARYYIPQLGRFIGRDPMGYVDGCSLYQYVGSGPLGPVDPWGLCSRSKCKAVANIWLKLQLTKIELNLLITKRDLDQLNALANKEMAAAYGQYRAALSIAGANLDFAIADAFRQSGRAIGTMWGSVAGIGLPVGIAGAAVSKANPNAQLLWAAGVLANTDYHFFRMDQALNDAVHAAFATFRQARATADRTLKSIKKSIQSIKKNLKKMGGVAKQTANTNRAQAFAIYLRKIAKCKKCDCK